MTIQGTDYRTGKPVEIVCEDGRIESVSPCEGEAALPLIAPGLIDLQINGVNGVDFNSVELKVEDVRKAIRHLLQNGVCLCFPTLITNSEENLARILSVLREACEQDELVRSCIGGIHLEGPFISPEDGARGAHDARYVCDPDVGLIERLQDVSGGRIRLVTLAPERPGAIEFIRHCTAAGIQTAIGHSLAEPEQIEAAANAGATMSTHLGNAAPSRLPRHPNLIWQQLADDRLSAGFIADGFHLPEAFMRVLLRAKGERAFLVSDATCFAGMLPGDYKTHIGGSVTLSPEGRLCLSENPALLAGAAKLLPQEIEHLVSAGLTPLADAWDLASLAPARAAGLKTRGLFEGAPADLVLFEMKDNRILIQDVLKNGKIVK